ncbi:hypothetical protein [Scytonema sp. HK-05]|uniref:hypothetical protein n=1 Tax=Scytonema sp. HK-05 TaxID=1137095 RepID=UPI000936482A|nr:hypothetical protein [Scytonema sp. HK-05]OKH56654.1 hypothetical protein NIES2130_24050 [Scytonema sp. HK-05]
MKLEAPTINGTPFWWWVLHRSIQVSPQKFITGARAWQICREDASKGNVFGWAADIAQLN